MTDKGEYDDENGIETGSNINNSDSGPDSDDIPTIDVPLVDIPVRVGWVCPICHYGISPFADYCPCRD